VNKKSPIETAAVEPMTLLQEARCQREARLELEFLAKWTTEERKTLYGDYWTATPSRLYWCLLYEVVAGWDAVAISEELVSIYESTGPEKTNSALARARSLLMNTR